MLVLRVDFADVQGEGVSPAAAQKVLDNDVRPFLERSSYGQTSIVSTVGTRLYRLPQTAAFYAVNDEYDQLYTDAVAAAAGEFTAANFDRVIIVVPLIDSSRVPGSKFTWGGIAEYSGSRIWINAAFYFRLVAHELGHTYGAMHASFWTGSASDPLAPQGTRVAFGDPYDIMGGGSRPEHDYAAYSKWLMGWIPDAAVTTATQSGVYRIYRHDDAAAALNGPLAVRIFRDGFRSYWLSYRAGATNNADLDAGADVIWALNDRNDFVRLDLAAPYGNTGTVALRPGSLLNDAPNGITARVIGIGGNAPRQYLDVEVTVARAARPAVAAWGAAQSYETTQPVGVGDAMAVAAGDFHSLALRRDGTVWTGGFTNSFGEDRVPEGLRDVVSVAAGRYVSGAVKSDGTIVLWGDNSNGLLTPPVGLGGVRALALGQQHALALRPDGTVVAWGRGNGSGVTIVPPGLADVVAVAAGWLRSLALKRNGTVIAWGNGSLQVPAGLTGVAAIAAGSDHVLALKVGGTVVAWGSNSAGQTAVPVGLSGVKAIAAGQSHSVALLADGSVVSWGNQVTRTRGADPFHDTLLVPPAGMPPARAISAGVFHTMAVTGGIGAPLVGAATQKAGGFTAQWSEVAGATGYRLEVASDPTFGTLVAGFNARDVGKVASAQVTGLVPGAAYFFRVWSVAANGDAVSSNIGVVAPEPIGAPVASAATQKSGEFTAQWSEVAGAISYRLDVANSPAFSTFVAGFSARDLGKATSMQIAGLDRAATYFYRVWSVGANGDAAVSNTAVVAPEPSRLGNLSVRSFAGIGERTLIAGFVVGGNGPKPLLVRAVGPKLAAFSVANVLVDPQLELYRADAKLQENDDWSGDDGRGFGAFPLDVGAKDAVLTTTLAPGAYTAQVKSANGATGNALIEIYEMGASPGAQLTNLSARTQLDVGQTLIAGFVITGGAAKALLIRSAGPALAAFLDGAHPDPKLELFGSTGRIQENDSWSGDDGRGIGAFPFATGSKDAALRVTLTSGTYTVHASGVGLTSGVLLLEIYAVP